MTKNAKSSSTSATRKKHARKAAGGEVQQIPLPKEKKKDKAARKREKENRVKVYIPPSKPAPIRPDPLDSMGIAKQLPSEMSIVLRRLGKKDVVTKRKALEDLQASWLDPLLSRKTEDAVSVEATLAISLPVWFHHLPSLFLSASRRIRLLTAVAQVGFLRVPSLHKQILNFLHETGDAVQVETILGSWSMAAEDVDKQVAAQAKCAWELAFPQSPAPDESQLTAAARDSSLDFVKRALFEPIAVYVDLYPVQPTIDSTLPAHALPRGKGGTKRLMTPNLVTKATEVENVRKAEEEDESEADRRARLRVGALGVLRWMLETQDTPISESSLDLFANTLLWTSLYHGSSPPFCSIQSSSGFIGHNQVIVRKAAWLLLLGIMKNNRVDVQPIIGTLSSAVLRSAWVEPDSGVRAVMLEPLLVFLKRYPQAWELDLAANSLESRSKELEGEEVREGDDEEDDEKSDVSGEQDDNSINVEEPDKNTWLPPPRTSEAYQEFLQFLQLGCYGSPLEGYPTVIIIVSTIPPSIFSSGYGIDIWSNFFNSFWAALDGRALSSPDRSASSAAFLSALLECLAFLVRRHLGSLRGNPQADDALKDKREVAKLILKAQMSKVWEELVSGRLCVDPCESGRLLARTYTSLAATNEELYVASWEPIASSVLTACAQEQPPECFSQPIMQIRTLLNNVVSGTVLSRSLTALVLTLTSTLLNNCERVVEQDKDAKDAITPSMKRVLDVFYKFGPIIFGDSTMATRIDQFMQRDLTILLFFSPSLVLAYMAQRGDPTVCLSLWALVLKAIASDHNLQDCALSEFLSGAERGLLPFYLKPEDDEMDGLASVMVTDVLEGGKLDQEKLATVQRLLQRPSSFVSRHAVSGLLHSIVYAFSESSRGLIRGEASASESIEHLRAPLDLIFTSIRARPEAARAADIRQFLPDIAMLGYLYPRIEKPSDAAEQASVKARQIWEHAISTGLDLEEREELYASVRRLLRDLISDVNCRASPIEILQMVKQGHFGDATEAMQDIFPTQEQLERLLGEISGNPLDPALAIIDPFVPPKYLWQDEPTPSIQYDSQGLSEYARIVVSLLSLATLDRNFARSNMWILRHFLTLYHEASDKLALPIADSVYFSRSVDESILKNISERVQILTSFLFAEVRDGIHHEATIKAVYKEAMSKADAGLISSVGEFTVGIVKHSVRSNSFRDARVLRSVMKHILGDADTSDAEQWIEFARNIENRAPNAALAIASAVNESTFEPSSLGYYRNRLAADALGISPARVNSVGVLLVHKLVNVAPPPDSDVVYLPQNRAVNFMKACQNWIASDEDIDEGVEVELTLIFLHLATILHTVPGAHWDFIFDMIENNLENSSFSDGASLTALYHTLKLIGKIRELASTNKPFRTSWSGREMAILRLVRDLVQKAPAPSSYSLPKAICWETALSIMQELPSSLIDHECLANMAHILLDPSATVAKMAYTFLHDAAKRRTEYLVIEAGVDTSGDTLKYGLPAELLQVLHAALEVRDDHAMPNIFGYLLGWMVIFDLFADASLKVKIGYANQLKDSGLIGSSLLPILFDLLEVYVGRSKMFPLDLWSVEEYHIQLYDPSSHLSPKLLAAHLFYRALQNVPSLISTWWRDCRDKQLSATVASLTTKHYSLVLTAAELGSVRKHSSLPELSGENWSVKVAPGSGEVSASYTVDDQEMEIAIRIPPNYPLNDLEVREVRRLGVDDKKWRGWLLAVQQIITSQNGRIVDGLIMFKKNVTHHFENQTECAICYSIISVTELSLPKKRCKTCKNRFHAGCLYKWFNTSHTSSCPLCRSDFI